MNRSTLRFCALALAAASVPACTGLSQADLEDGLPNLTVVLHVDAGQYARNAPVIANVSITNAGDSSVSHVMPARETLEFNLFTTRSPEPLHVEFVASPLEPIQFNVLEPGATLERKFILPLAARMTGDLRLIAVYRPEIGEGMQGSLPIASEAAVYTVQDPPAFDRDSNGVISEADAIRIATAYFARSPKAVRANYLLDEMKFGMWLVTAEFAQPDANGKSQRACYVNAYLGQVSTRQARDDEEKFVSHPPRDVGT